jgi:glycosyltransferase involved in cell wall biosynthesis
MTILESSDLVFTNCSQLAEHCKAWNDNVSVFPPGVDLEAFLPRALGDNNHRGALSASTGIASDAFLQSLPRPVIGYVGGLHRWVDYDLLVKMARARPRWSWVFVGAITTQIGELAELPNVHLLGQKPHSDLAHFVNGFDVCTIPYVNNPATVTVAPVKLNEYLAASKPVVSTELPTVCEFNQQHKILLTSANEPESFLRAIEQALNLPNDVGTTARRREVAALSEWQTRLDAMSDLIEMKVQERSQAGS